MGKILQIQNLLGVKILFQNSISVLSKESQVRNGPKIKSRALSGKCGFSVTNIKVDRGKQLFILFF